MVSLIPPPETILGILKKTGAFREGHFRYYDTARVLAVALSRMFRIDRDVASQLPKIAIISPSPGGIPVAFGVREALSAEQIYWAETENGQRMFRQYVSQGEVHPCIIIDDIIRSGRALNETVELVKSLGTEIIGIGTIVHFNSAVDNVDNIPIKTLVDFESKQYDTWEECVSSVPGVDKDAPIEHVRF
jgi:orotate phosphoribosyltransferase